MDSTPMPPPQAQFYLNCYSVQTPCNGSLPSLGITWSRQDAQELPPVRTPATQTMLLKPDCCLLLQGATLLLFLSLAASSLPFKTALRPGPTANPLPKVLRTFDQHVRPPIVGDSGHTLPCTTVIGDHFSLLHLYFLP